MKEEALKLADLMIDVTDSQSSDFYKAGQMIRKLVAHIEELENPIMRAIAQAFEEPKELSDEEILVLYEEFIETQYVSESNVLGFGRAILKKASEK